MKKQVIAIFVASLLYLPISCFASYIIELNNGHKFITELWWKEGALIKFYIYGGVIGLDRNTFRRIETSNLKVASVPAAVKKSSPEKKISGDEKKSATTEENDQTLREEKQLLDNENIAVIAAFSKARKSGDDTEIKKAREKLTEVETKRQTLQEKAKGANNGNLPNWWNN